MKRKLWFIAIPAVLVLAAGAVAVVLLSNSKQASAPEQSDDMSALPVQVQYVKIEEVNPGSVNEVKIAIPEELGSSPDVCTWQDGSSLALGEKVEYANSGKLKKVSSVKIMAAKFDAQGNTLWNKAYSDLGDGYVSLANTLPGGGFVFTYNALAKSDDEQQKDCIVFCGPDGSVLKTYSYGQPGILGKLCVTDAGDVYAAGGCVFANGTPAIAAGLDDTNSDVSILKFSSDGSLLFARKFGGGGYDSATGAVWSKDTGLVVSVSTQSSDGDIKLPEGIIAGAGPMGMLVCFDGDGHEKWQYFEPGRISYNQLLAMGGGVALSGYKDGKPFLTKRRFRRERKLLHPLPYRAAGRDRRGSHRKIFARFGYQRRVDRGARPRRQGGPQSRAGAREHHGASSDGGRRRHHHRHAEHQSPAAARRAQLHLV
jgi:hypothetical protein